MAQEALNKALSLAGIELSAFPEDYAGYSAFPQEYSGYSLGEGEYAEPMEYAGYGNYEDELDEAAIEY